MLLAQNRARLKFYEQYGAYPIVGTAYETPVKPEDDNPPYLVLDPLGRTEPLPREPARRIVRAILERRYGHLCSPEYIERVVAYLPGALICYAREQQSEPFPVTEKIHA